MSDNPRVSVIVLSHDRPVYMKPVLDSLMAQTYDNLEIIVVDNKSRSSDQIEAIVRDYPRVRLIKNCANLGFTGGMNKGIEAATGRYGYFTLDDIILEKDCIFQLTSFMESNPQSGLVSGILYQEDGETIVCAGGEFDLSSVYKRVFLGTGEKEAGQFSQPFNVTWIPGGTIFTRLDLMRRLNGFRQEFFMYSEDVELCARVLKLGYNLTVVPQAKVFVINAPHAFTSEEMAFHKFKNFFSVYLLHARLSVLPEFYLRYGVINLLRAFFSNRKIVWPMVRAWGWFLLKTPSLVKDRYRSASL